MYKEFKTYITDHQLFEESNRILVAVSGGLDSMVLLDLLLRHNYPLEVAHLNYQLRGKDSEKDMLFVKAYCTQHNIPCHIKVYDLAQELKRTTDNLQARARDIRYAYFDEICDMRDMNYIAVAHHADDRIENFFISALRGTGLSGLSSLKLKNRNIVRPLLFASKKEIELYADRKMISHREDISNQDSKYRRNFMRNIVLPSIEKKIPNYRKSVLRTIENITEDKSLLDRLIDEKAKSIALHNDQYDIWMYPKQYDLSLYYHILNRYGLNKNQVSDLLNANTGTLLEENGYQFLNNRNHIIIRKTKDVRPIKEVMISQSDLPMEILGYKIAIRNDDATKSRSSELMLDANVLQWPISIRSWKAGDRFTPYGMNGKTKSVKKFLVDKKINLFEKEEILIVKSQESICAILPIDISDPYKITDQTSKYLSIHKIKN